MRIPLVSALLPSALFLAGCGHPGDPPYTGLGAELVGTWNEEGICDSEQVSCAHVLRFGADGSFGETFDEERRVTAVVRAGCRSHQELRGATWEAEDARYTVLGTRAARFEVGSEGCLDPVENTRGSQTFLEGQVVTEVDYVVSGNRLTTYDLVSGLERSYLRP